jgi:Fe-S cluster assembly iron-binding protein IscA
MLRMTSQAATMLSRAQAESGLPDHFGVRIFANTTGDTNGDANSASKYRLGFVEGPDEGDAIGKAEGTTYYVAPELPRRSTMSYSSWPSPVASPRLVLTHI